ESLPSVNFGDPPWACAEAMDEPGQRCEGISVQDFAFRFSGKFCGHRIILATACAQINKWQVSGSGFPDSNFAFFAPFAVKRLNRKGRKGRVSGYNAA